MIDFLSGEKADEINAINNMLEEKKIQCLNSGRYCLDGDIDGTVYFYYYR